MNEFTYDTARSDLSPRIFAENLPDFETSFDVTFTDKPPGSTFDNFADELYDFGTS